MLRTKKGVNLTGVEPVMFFAMGVWYMLRKKHNCPPPTITSANDSHEKKPGSLHNKGLGFDVRVFDISAEKRAAIVREARAILDPLGFDIVSSDSADEATAKAHKNHDHIEYDPKGSEAWLREGAS